MTDSNFGVPRGSRLGTGNPCESPRPELKSKSIQEAELLGVPGVNPGILTVGPDRSRASGTSEDPMAKTFS